VHSNTRLKGEPVAEPAMRLPLPGLGEAQGHHQVRCAHGQDMVCNSDAQCHVIAVRPSQMPMMSLQAAEVCTWLYNLQQQQPS
jgi:hypothetical protein